MGCRGGHCNNYYTPCIMVSSYCGGFDGSYNNYSCPGHTEQRPDNRGNFSNYLSGDIISYQDINLLRNEVVKELNARKVHPLYEALRTSPEISGVSRGDIIDHGQQNSIASAIKLMAERANANNNILPHGDASLGLKNDNPHFSVTEDIVAVSDLQSLEGDLDSYRYRQLHNNLTSALSGIMQDCICYSDCALFNKGGKFVCACYGYCCHYGSN